MHPLGGGSSLAMLGQSSRSSGKSSGLSQDSGQLESWDRKEATGSDMPEGVADANQHPGTGDNMALGWGDEEVVQYAWTDSERHMAAALLGLVDQTASAQPGPTGPNASSYRPPQVPDLSTAVSPAEGGRSATCHPNGADGSYSAGDNDRPRPRHVHQEAEHAEPSHVAEGRPTGPRPHGQERGPIRSKKRISPRDKDVLEAAYQQNSSPSKNTRLRIMQRVSMDEKQIQIWFHNRRQADRRRR
ncbi:hypothetical protein F4779DRAFT_585775 [Xylariaceae sp. FL0662B]|nr:hypothetical protein F4779DRAFT_585775 [Xylariaceae sp. FL0662B]